MLSRGAGEHAFGTAVSHPCGVRGIESEFIVNGPVRRPQAGPVDFPRFLAPAWERENTIPIVPA